MNTRKDFVSLSTMLSSIADVCMRVGSSMLANPDTPQRSQQSCRSGRCQRSSGSSNQSLSNDSMMQSAFSAMSYLVPPSNGAGSSRGCQARSGSCPSRMGCRHSRSPSGGRDGVYDPRVNRQFSDRFSREATRSRVLAGSRSSDRAGDMGERRRRQEVAEARLRFFGSHMRSARNQPSVTQTPSVMVYGTGLYNHIKILISVHVSC